MTDPLGAFAEVWLADFEFHAPSGERPEPLCLVAREYRSGRLLRLWRDELLALDAAPYPTDPRTLFVAYYNSAELGCHLALGWPLPVRSLDLYAEFRCQTSGLPTVCGNGLLGALAYFGLPGWAKADKAAMQGLAIRGGPYTPSERADLLDYCQSDVDALAKLLPAMLPRIDLPRALLRGRYMAAVAWMEARGVPIDVDTLERLRTHWPAVQGKLAAEVDRDYGVFVPTGINPQTAHGAAILEAAAEYEISPHHLAEAVQELWASERNATAELRDAFQKARQATGLTAAKLDRWEDSGRDHTSWPHLDTTAREFAREYPALGIGPGYIDGGGADGHDYAGRLWELLRGEAPKARPKHDASLIREAIGQVLAGGSANQAGPMSFSADRWAKWLAKENIPWPYLASGALDLSDDTFRQMAKQYPHVAPIRELRHTLSQLRLNSLAVGSDGRNRCLLSVFKSCTGRNQPSNSKFIFGPSVWLRGLIQPAPEMAVAYIDWEQQEFGIAAALSHDVAMMEAYASGDPYLAFARQAGAVPADATKQSHKAEREAFKICALAVQYGMAEQSLAQHLGECEARARELLRLHRQTYPTFWQWSQAVVDFAMLRGYLQTVFGWRVHVGGSSNPRSLANFPMQANGAEMLRLACCLIAERGLGLCAPVHDAVLIEAPADRIEGDVAECQACMAEASEVVLDGFRLRSDVEIIRWPDRYSDPRGQRMWEIVGTILDELDGGRLAEIEADALDSFY